MKKAARNAGEKISRSRKDILEWVESENGPMYREHVRDFLEYFAKWADGNGTDRTLSAKFKEVVDKPGLATQKEIQQSVRLDQKGKVIGEKGK